MRRYSRRQFLTVAGGGIAATYVLAACGDDDDAGGSPTAVAEATAAASPTVDAGADRGATGVRWFGQSMFLVTSPGGTTVLMDPFGNIGYTMPPPLDADAATITHEHPDHNNDVLAGEATLLRGLTADGWADIDETFGDVRIRMVRAFHDQQEGAQLGRNAIFVVESAGMTLVHAGDLGHTLSDEQISAIGRVDALMVPVGGSFTLDAEGATEVTNQLSPRIVFPMHYRTERAGEALADAESFLADKTVQRTGSNTIRLSADALPEELTAYVLDYE